MNNKPSFGFYGATRCLALVMLTTLGLSPVWAQSDSATAGPANRVQEPRDVHSQSRHADGRHHDRSDPYGGDPYDNGYLENWGPAIGLSIAPEDEHWRSNYTPDSYQLKGYDGRSDDGHHVCRGKHSMTLSSRPQPCPPGEKPSRGGRSWSTDK